MSIKLQQPIIDGSLTSTNFFNGRLVTGADLTREQTARREALRRVGQAAGEGVISGLEVVKNAVSGGEPVVDVNAGSAVNRCGQVLYLAQETSVNLLQRFGAVEQASNIFAACQPLQTGTYTAGYGLYLLVLSPAESNNGSAPTSGLNNAFATCGTDVILETAQFRLLAIDPFLTEEVLPGNQLLRNFVAYRCFGDRNTGTSETEDFFKNPFGFSIASYGLIDQVRGKTLADCDVPLALIHWTSSGLEFVEMWAVRRRVTRQNDADDWRQLISDRRAAETEAMMNQFVDQLETLQLENNNLQTVEADDYFQYLPPAGVLPLAAQGSSLKGFDTVKFFGNRVSTDITSMDGDRLRVLLREAISHEPIDLAGSEKIQLYYIRENLKAFDNGEKVQKALVFARHSLPYFGVARFDEAVWNIDRFSAPVK